jgi:hypothetical protein
MPKRIVTIEQVKSKFPLGCDVMSGDERIGWVIGYNESLPEPEVCVRCYRSGRITQFTIRSPKYKVAPPIVITPPDLEVGKWHYITYLELKHYLDRYKLEVHKSNPLDSYDYIVRRIE